MNLRSVDLERSRCIVSFASAMNCGKYHLSYPDLAVNQLSGTVLAQDAEFFMQFAQKLLKILLVIQLETPLNWPSKLQE